MRASQGRGSNARVSALRLTPLPFCACFLKKMRSSPILRNKGNEEAGGGLRQISQHLLVALIENEINSALIFTSVARSAFLATKFSDGNSALSKAEAIYGQALELSRDELGDKTEMISNRLRELRSAIDVLIGGETGK